MLKLYMKQAWMLLRQNPLFSTLYIVGTGLAIGITMLVAEIYYVKLAPVYPEQNRARTLYLTQVEFKIGEMQWNSSLSYNAYRDWMLPLENKESLSATYYSWNMEREYIQPGDRSGDFSVQVKYTDPAFFRIYGFRFLAGNPFTESDLASGIHVAVLADDVARRLFGSADSALGQTISLGFVRYRVCGVVRSASYLTPRSYAQVYMPYSVVPGYEKEKYAEYPNIGNFEITFLVKDDAQAGALHAEIADLVRRLNLEHKDECEINIWEQPMSHVLSVFQEYPNLEFDFWAKVRFFGLLLLVLLLVPALNLSGLIASRMEGRLPEMGVRKSFGAGRNRLLGQVMWENLLLTLLGGVLGLVLAWTFIYAGREWFFSLLQEYAEPFPEGVDAYVSGEMLFAPLVFLCAFLLCVVLNLLSALLPAWQSLRKPIVQSLFERR